LQKAIEDEVSDYINGHRQSLDDQGHRLVVRNGHKPPRTTLTRVGPIELTAPRVDDRRVDENGQRFRFTSKILPPYLRKTRVIEGRKGVKRTYHRFHVWRGGYHCRDRGANNRSCPVFSGVFSGVPCNRAEVRGRCAAMRGFRPLKRTLL
jgi:hypothetical protein